MAAEIKVIWEPQPQQAKFITCPVDDVAFGGARGGGKSDAVIGDFIDHESRYGECAVALAVRRERVELLELMERGKQIAVPIGFRWKEQDKMLIGPRGGRMRFAYLENDSDADGYQGHSYTRLYPEEIGTFPSERPINKLQATLRSGHGVPCQMKGTCNPGGAGHQWVKARYRLDTHPHGMTVFEDKFTNPFNGEEITKRRVFIPSKVSDNRYLGTDYVANLYLVGDAQLVRAWLDGDWTVIAGSYFPEFNPILHIVRPVSLPNHWTRIRALDWGSAKPFSVGWYAVSDGELAQFPRGALIKYREWYGVKKDKNGRAVPNVGLGMTAEEVGDGIREMEAPGEVQDAVADPSIFAHNGGPSIAERMNNNWRPGDNARVGKQGAMGGWDQLRARLVGEGKRDPETLNIDWRDGRPMLYIMEQCEHTIRTLPSIQRDPTRVEDVDTEGEDHAADETRYACMSRPWIREAPQQEAQRNKQILEQAKFGNDRNIQQIIADQSRRRKAAYL